MSHSLKESVLPCLHEHKPIIHHSHEHGEHEHHHHTHEVNVHRPQQRRALFICVVLTALMMVVEFIAGYLTGSLMLVSDAIHMLSHATALSVSFLAVILAQRKTSEHLPFGLYRVEILAAFFNGIGLAGFSVWIVYEGVLRILNPVNILGPELTAVALIGLAVNLTTAVILQKAGLEDLNTKSAFLHMLADTFSSIAIVVGGIIISFTNWIIVDPILSMFVAVLVTRWSWGLLRDSVLILLERKPDNVNVAEIQSELRTEFPTIKDIHDLHIWEITSQFVCLSAHIVLDDMKLSETQNIRSNITEHLKHHFGIAHAVIQVEC
ncbi:MAG: cation diffusion facilitator family transporter [Bacteroidota bacterium]